EEPAVEDRGEAFAEEDRDRVASRRSEETQRELSVEDLDPPPKRPSVVEDPFPRRLRRRRERERKLQGHSERVAAPERWEARLAPHRVGPCDLARASPALGKRVAVGGDEPVGRPAEPAKGRNPPERACDPRGREEPGQGGDGVPPDEDPPLRVEDVQLAEALLQAQLRFEPGKLRGNDRPAVNPAAPIERVEPGDRRLADLTLSVVED